MPAVTMKKKTFREKLMQSDIVKNRWSYLLLLPALIFIIVFAYIPMVGVLIAFEDFDPVAGMFASKWTGWENFKFFFSSSSWIQVTLNTLYLNTLFIVTGTIGSLFIAVIMCELKNKVFVKTSQTLMTLPNFVSWATVALFSVAFFSSDGVINNAVTSLGGKSIPFYSNPDVWPTVFVVIRLWKGAGWGAIVYMAAILGIDQSIYEAAKIDGASKVRCIFSITLPLIKNIVVLMFIMSIGNVFKGDFGMIYLYRRQRVVISDDGRYRYLRVPRVAFVYKLRQNGGDRVVSVDYGLRTGAFCQLAGKEIRAGIGNLLKGGEKMERAKDGRFADGKPAKKRGNKVSGSTGDKALLIFFYVFAAVFALLCLYPFYQVLISSFADENTLIREGYRLIPSKFSLNAYRTLFASDEILWAYGITIFVTVVGTAASLLVTSMAAYALSGQKLKYRNAINFFFYFTMLFSGGLIPYYILIKNYLHLSNNLLVYILPGMFNVWNMFLLRNFFNEIPAGVREAARIDGANEVTTAFKIILPLSLPALATIGLFSALSYWNEWMASMLYIDNPKLYTLQYLIVRMVNSVSAATNLGQSGLPTGISTVPANTLRLATAIVTIGPIVLLYPFLQKYFVSGLKVGGVKE